MNTPTQSTTTLSPSEQKFFDSLPTVPPSTVYGIVAKEIIARDNKKVFLDFIWELIETYDTNPSLLERSLGKEAWEAFLGVIKEDQQQ